MSEWRPIKSFRGPGRRKVDLWLAIHPSLSSMGWGDAFRIIDAWRVDGRWFHDHEGKELELRAEYITHWMPIVSPSEVKL